VRSGRQSSIFASIGAGGPVASKIAKRAAATLSTGHEHVFELSDARPRTFPVGSQTEGLVVLVPVEKWKTSA
jgi:hypothetical protein